MGNPHLIQAYSKINFILQVYPRQPGDIKHKIKSLFVRNERLFDVINIEYSPKDEIQYFVEGKVVVIPNCSIHKTLQYLKNRFTISKYYHIAVEKNIPILAGLGGSATDAAAIILFVLEDNKIKVSRLNMKEIALMLGSDIPFFLSQYDQAVVSNYGDVVLQTKYKLPKFQVILTNEAVSTEQAYKLLDSSIAFQSLVDFNDCMDALLHKKITSQKIYNDIQPYALEINPKLKQIFQKLQQDNKMVLISGSGGSIVELLRHKG